MTTTTTRLEGDTSRQNLRLRPSEIRKSRANIVVLVVTVVVLIGGVVGFAVTSLQARQKADLVAKITAVRDQEPASDNGLADELAVAAKLTGTNPASVTDVAVLSNLKAAEAAARTALAASTAPGTAGQTLDELNALLLTDQSVLDGNDKALADLKAAEATVLLSKATREAADATGVLTSEIANVKTVLAGSEGKVADNAVRQALQESIDRAARVSGATPEATVAGQDAQTEAVNVAIADLRSKSEAVSNAMISKAAADAAAAKQSSGASATTTTKSTTSSTKTGTSTKTSTGSTSTGSTTGSTGQKAGSAVGGGTCPTGMVCQG